MPMIMEGTRPPTGASPTQSYKCSQYVKIKTTHAAVGAENFQPLHHPHQRGFDFDFKHFDRIYKVR